jgi:pyruvate/2-oxoglutarate dehydrogenase complex dihydrolipoamide dehydrogenase (E3) component
VALVERHLMGATASTWDACRQGRYRAARAWQAAADASRAFAGPRVLGAGNVAEVMERMRRIRAGLSRVDSAARFRELGVDVFLGEAKFIARDAAEVSGKTLRFRRAVIATGARAAAPPIPGLERAGYLTNETVFSLTELPQHLVVLGAGPVGCELAQAFARLGARVTLINRDAHVLPREDADAARVVEQAMERHGVRLLHQSRSVRVETHGDQRVVSVERDGCTEEVAGDQLLVAVGRAPNVEGLGLEPAVSASTARASRSTTGFAPATADLRA